MRAHQDGDFPFANDFNALVRGALEGSTQVESGCAVSDGGTQDMSVSVASGNVIIGGAKYSISSQSVSLASADPDNPRYDLVVADSTGASAVTGTASSTPKAPSIPSGSVLLAIVEVPAGVSGVIDAEINDARVILDGIANTAIAALQNLSEGDSFSGYPLEHGVDVDAASDAHHIRPVAGENLYENNGSFGVKDSAAWMSLDQLSNWNYHEETHNTNSDTWHTFFNPSTAKDVIWLEVDAHNKGAAGLELTNSSGTTVTLGTTTNGGSLWSDEYGVTGNSGTYHRLTYLKNISKIRWRNTGTNNLSVYGLVVYR